MAAAACLVYSCTVGLRVISVIVVNVIFFTHWHKSVKTHVHEFQSTDLMNFYKHLCHQKFH